jgi:hypothetical protein
MIMRNKGSRLMASVSMAMLSLLIGGAVVAQNAPNGGMNGGMHDSWGGYSWMWIALLVLVGLVVWLALRKKA